MSDSVKSLIDLTFNIGTQDKKGDRDNKKQGIVTLCSIKNRDQIHTRGFLTLYND